MTSGSAGSRLTGLRAWWVQRVSAAWLLLFVLFLLYSFAGRPPGSYAEWKSWVGRPGMTLAFVAFFVALLAHMWVGLRDVLLDYARPARVRSALLAAVALALVAIGVWAMAILLRLQR